MNASAENSITRTYLQKLDWQNYLATAVALLIVTLSLLWMLFRLGGANTVTFFADIMYTVAAWIGACWACATAYRGRYGPLRLEPRHQLAWLLIGLGMFANGLGGIYFTYLEQTGLNNPVPSLGDIGFTLFYPLVFIGLLLMPAEQKSRSFRVRIGLDACITTLCILGLAWYFFIGPSFVFQRHAHVTLAKLLTVMSYPFWDMLLILAIMLMIWRPAERLLRPSLLICVIGIFSLIWADLLYAYFTALNVYSTGTPSIDTFWFVGSLLIGLSALYQYSTIVRRTYTDSTHPVQTAERTENAVHSRNQKRQHHLILLQSMLIYLPFSVLLGFLLYSELTEDNTISFFLVVLTAIVGLLVTVRYLFATQENELLLREREQQRKASERLRLLTAQLNEVLELDSLLERIVTMAPTALGFDAVILLLIEGNEQTRQKHVGTRFIASLGAGALGSLETPSWYFQDTHLPQTTILLGKEMQVVRAEQNSMLPPEVQMWQEQERIQATLFVPLTYHGQIQGSIGFSSCSTQHFSQDDIHLAEAFAKEATTAIEHARLYQETHEHELFATAMVNIAARLNTAVAEPIEIHQLICTEGAKALQADYVLLYIPDGPQGQLVLLDAFSNEEEARAILSEWPAIQPYEEEAQAFNSLQPILLQLGQPIIANKKLQGFRTPALSGTGRDKSGPYSHSRPDLPAILPARINTGGLRRRAYSLYETLAQRFVHTAILAPLIARDEPIGLLVLARSVHPETPEKKSFASMDLAQAQDFAEQAAIAFTNAQLYQQLRDAHRRQQELDQLKDQFMITASHELRTPLTAVQGYLELVEQYGEMLPAHQRQEFLQKAQRGCEELVLLLGNVMDASRLEIEAGIRPAHIERVSVQEAFKSVLDLIEPHLTLEKRERYLAIPAHLFVHADPARMRQVLLNLSMNALKYSLPGTPLAFSARAATDFGPVIISVADKGKGIAPKDQGRIFERFFRLEQDVNSPVRGSGLGLYISRRLIEAMDGTIEVESTGIPGAGSTFHIRLPMA